MKLTLKHVQNKDASVVNAVNISSPFASYYVENKTEHMKTKQNHVTPLFL